MTCPWLRSVCQSAPEKTRRSRAPEMLDLASRTRAGMGLQPGTGGYGRRHAGGRRKDDGHTLPPRRRARWRRWTAEPFGLTPHGKLIGRGVIDDGGPALAAVRVAPACATPASGRRRPAQPGCDEEARHDRHGPPQAQTTWPDCASRRTRSSRSSTSSGRHRHIALEEHRGRGAGFRAR